MVLKKSKLKVLSAGIIPILRNRQDKRYLLLRVYNYWDFPKGVVQSGETPLQAAIRELGEETTLTNPRFIWGEDFIETEPYSGGKVARYYLAEVEDHPVSLPVNPYLGTPEHHEFRWVSAAQARKLLTPRLSAVLKWAEERTS